MELLAYRITDKGRPATHTRISYHQQYRCRCSALYIAILLLKIQDRANAAMGIEYVPYRLPVLCHILAVVR